MKGVRCSWVDMQKIREALSVGERGSQKHMEHMRCVDKSTIAKWKKSCDLIDAIEGKVAISQLSSFQPSHAVELTRALRKRHGKPEDWPEEVKDEAADWVDLCETQEWTVQQLRDALLLKATAPTEENPGCTVDSLDVLVQDGEQFGTIYADPPWQYGNQATRASTSKHYLTMTVDEIAALPVAKLAAENAHLHLWTTNAFLRQSFDIIEAWGFEYKSVFVWHKDKMGIGNYWRLNHEFLMLGIRGDCPFRTHNLLSCEKLPRGKHSSKPEQVRDWIMKTSPPSYLEMFGRHRIPGWAVWGNQIESSMFTQDIKNRTLTIPEQTEEEAEIGLFNDQEEIA